jgi:hypothetical protein
MWLDALVYSVWIAVTWLSLQAAWVLARGVFPQDGWMPALANTLVLFWAGLVGISFSLGGLGYLSGWTLLISAGVLALVTLAIPCRHVAGGPPSEDNPSTTSTADTWKWLWFCLLALALSRVVFDGLLQFPRDWDTLTYHLPLVVQWLRCGSLYAPADAFWYNPGNNELMTLWLVAPFSGDFLQGLTNLPALILLACGSVELSKTLGARPNIAHLAGFAVLATWPVIRQLVTAENDLSVVALFVTTLHYATRHVMNGRCADLVFACTAMGLLAGLKYYALGYAVVGSAYLVSLVYCYRGVCAALRSTLFCLLGFLVLASYWYCRNAVVTGSPIFPKGLTAEDDWWSRMRPESRTSSLFGNGRPEIWPLAFQGVGAMTGICHLGAIITAPISSCWFVYSSCRLAKHLGTKALGLVRAGMVFVMLASFMVMGLTPNFVEIVPGTMDMLRRQYLPARFALCFLSIAIIVFAVTLSDLFVGLQRWWSSLGKTDSLDGNENRWPGFGYVPAFSIALATIPAWQFYGHWTKAIEKDLIDRSLLTVNLLALFFWASLFSHVAHRFRRLAVYTSGIGLLLGGSLTTAFLSYTWHDAFFRHYGKMYSQELLHQVSLAADCERICVCDYRYYPFFGSRRQFAAHRPLWLPSAASFLKYLREHQSETIVTLRTDPYPQGRYDNIREWLDLHPELFYLSWERERSKHSVFKVTFKLRN